jgi:pyridoxine 5-phosphate synthase
MPTTLSVNLNKIALLRNSRGRDFPSLTDFGRLALTQGARGLTIHPRPDQRHARYDDIASLAALITEFPGSELNIEGNPTPEFIDIVIQARPAQCTLVPDDPNQLTSDHGYDVDTDGAFLKPIIARLQAAGIRVSLFMDPDPSAMAKAAALGTDRVELYTEHWAESFHTPDQDRVLAQFRETAAAAQAAGMGVNAGHDLDLHNVADFLTIPGIDEVSIGHALTIEALYQGYGAVVKQYVGICNDSA